MTIYILIKHEYHDGGYEILATGTNLGKINKKAEEYMTSEYWELDFDSSKVNKVKGWSNRQTQELLTVERHEI